MKRQERFFIVFVSFYLLAFLPPLFEFFLQWQYGVQIDWTTRNPLRGFYNLLYYVVCLAIILMLLQNLYINLLVQNPGEKISPPFWLVFAGVLFFGAIQIFLGFNYEYVLYKEWGFKPVCRVIDLSRELAIITLLYYNLKLVPTVHQRACFYWLGFNIINLTNFLGIFIWKFIANKRMPISAWLWVSCVVILTVSLGRWISTVRDFIKIESEPFTGDKSGIFLRAVPNLKKLIMAFALRKQGSTFIYFANVKEFYGICDCFQELKTRKKSKLDEYKFISFDLDLSKWDEVEKIIETLKGRPYHWSKFFCWTANDELLKPFGLTCKQLIKGSKWK